MAQTTLYDLEDRLDALFKKIPLLPNSLKPILVHYAPYAALVVGVLMFIGAGFLQFFFYSPSAQIFLFDVAKYNYYLLAIFNTIAGIILISSYPHLKKRSLKGWRMLFALMLIELLISMFSFNLPSLLFPIIGFYLLFQLKTYYT